MNDKIHTAFSTERLEVIPLNKDFDIDSLAEQTKELLSPEVTQSLPSGWQLIDTTEKALDWIKERAEESVMLLIQLKSELIGFIFLYIDDDNIEDSIAIRFGYLLGRESWGKGFGTEVLNGFVKWARNNKNIKSISGGVEKSNIGSIKVLEKVGFERLDNDTSDTFFYQYSFH